LLGGGTSTKHGEPQGDASHAGCRRGAHWYEVPAVDESKKDKPESARHSTMTAWFLGPKAEHFKLWQESFEYIFQDYANWRRNYFPSDSVVVTRERRREQYEWIDTLTGALDVMLAELKAHYPFYSPRYIAHMLSEQSLPSVLGYFAGMLYNPNNVTDEAAPVTAKREVDVGKKVAAMLGYRDDQAWTHICSGGTVATIEALWVARTVQFLPFVVRDICKREKIQVTAMMADGTKVDIGKTRSTDNLSLLHMRPRDICSLVDALFRAAIPANASEKDRTAKRERLKELIKDNKYNVRAAGLPAVCKAVNATPVVFVSEAAHYSLPKTLNILGYGEKAVRLVPVDENFRMDVEQLKRKIARLPRNKYVAAVVGIVGTTEEGAVDPIHEIVQLREELAKKEGRAFWLHVDAAWGGYISSVFRGPKMPPPLEGPPSSARQLDELCDEFMHAMEIRELPSPDRKVNWYPKEMREARIRRGAEGPHTGPNIFWADLDVYKAFLTMNEADSVVVDPHKMGYVPYPAGIVSFRDGRVTQAMAQRAQYISDRDTMFEAAAERPFSVEQIGTHILEGSKPGAAATACWLAHETIPLDRGGHGKIIKTSLLNARRLYTYLQEHRECFPEIDKSLGHTSCDLPFTFQVLTEPDTNIVVFAAVPMLWKRNDLIRDERAGLNELNQLNRAIYTEMSIDAKNPQRAPLIQEFFVSKTELNKKQYQYAGLSGCLEKLAVSKEEYEADEVFVLRSTVMNPFYFAAREVNTDYLFEFVRTLHKHARIHRAALARPNARRAEKEAPSKRSKA
jgi:glutamate/tyrosine decarboxylase-like PLP-dependent enzyme